MKQPLPLASPHPSLEGHFPGEPLLPGVVLLDEALHAIEAASGASGRWRIASVKFLGTVSQRPTLLLDYERTASGALRFTITDAGRPVAAGTLTELDGD